MRPTTLHINEVWSTRKVDIHDHIKDKITSQFGVTSVGYSFQTSISPVC